MKIVYLDNLPAKNGISILENQTKIKVVRIDSCYVEHSFRELRSANAFQISAARDEVPKIFHVNEDFLKKTPNLILVSSGGAGYDTIDVDACNKRGILVVNQSGGNAEAVAEHAVAMMLNLVKRITETDLLLRKGWKGTRVDFIGRNLYGKTIGIIGLGNTGGRVSKICKNAFKCKILAYDPYVNKERFKKMNAIETSIDVLLAKSDVVSIHIPLSNKTRNLIDRNFYKKMKKGSFFITTSRGSIHNEDDLVKFLENGHIAGAGLDVWEKEPPDASHKLLQFKNVVATPHLAGVTIDSRNKMSEFVANQLLKIMNGGEPDRPVNPEVLKTFKLKLNKII